MYTFECEAVMSDCCLLFHSLDNSRTVGYSLSRPFFSLPRDNLVLSIGFLQIWWVVVIESLSILKIKSFRLQFRVFLTRQLLYLSVSQYRWYSLNYSNFLSSCITFSFSWRFSVFLSSFCFSFCVHFGCLLLSFSGERGRERVFWFWKSDLEKSDSNSVCCFAKESQR